MPITTEGNIVVDGILASCYATYDHDMVHVTMAPLRWFPQMTHWIFGEKDGIPLFVNLIKEMAELAPASAQ